MTLLVGVLCRGGIVLCSDQQVTFAAMGVHTVGQRGEKIRKLSDAALFATSGHRGTGQQLHDAAARHARDFHKFTAGKTITLLQDGFRKILDPLYQSSRAIPGGFQEVATGGLLAGAFRDGVQLVEIAHTTTAEKMTSDIPFVTMGSGKAGADAFLGLLSDVFWHERQPTLQEGKLAAYWTVQHAIDMKVPGVGFGVDLFVLEEHGPGHTARQLEKAEFSEHDESIASIKNAMRSAVDFSAPSESTPPSLKKDKRAPA